jgi:hypothetical protein
MSIQWPLPGVAGWPRNASWPDPPSGWLSSKRTRSRRSTMRQVLDKYADKYGIRPKDVNELIWGYADDMISDLFYETEEGLRREIEEDIEREG